MRVLPLNDFGNFGIGFFYDGRVGCATDEARQGDHPVRRAPWKKRRIPHRPQRPDIFTSGDEESESSEIATDLAGVITGGDNRDRRVGDSGQRVRQGRSQ